MVSLGNDPQGLTRQLLDALRVDLLAQVGAQPAKSRFGMELSQLAVAIQCFTKALADFKITGHYSLPLELALYELCRPPGAVVSVAQSQPAAQVAQTAQKAAPSAVAAKQTVGSEPKRPMAQVVNVDSESLCMKGLSLIKDRNNSLYAVIRSANPRIEDDRLVMECPFSFHKERIEEQKNHQLIEQIMTKTFGHEIQLDCRLVQPKQSTEPVDSQKELVASALEILGGEVING
jgi:hypothetical protein